MVSRLKVLMTCQRMLPHRAGAELQALGLARALNALGVEVNIVTTKFTSGLRAHETLEGIPVRRLATLQRHSGNGATTDLRSALAKLSSLSAVMLHVASRARKFDVIHAHCVSASSLGAALGARLADVPVVVKPSLGGADGELRKLTGSRVGAQLLPVLRGIDRFAVTDPLIAEELLAVGVAPGKLIPVVNGIDLERFSPSDPRERRGTRATLGMGDGPVVLFVGQLVDRKGIRPLLDAWRATRISLPTAVLAFAGEGELDALVAREAAMPGSQIVRLGLRHDVPELMRGADLLVLPSRNESFGNVIVEALACGIPVVCGRTGVAQTLGLDGVAGRLVDPGNADAIARALVEILGSPDRGAALGARGPELVRCFDFRVVARSYLGMYEALRAARPSNR